MHLADDGQKLIEKAYLQADFNKDKTQNLHDSYGSAVYYNGSLYPGTKRYFSKMATELKYNTYTSDWESGRTEITKFLDTYKPVSKSIQLVVVAAMFYAGILENGEDHLRRKYKVIFMIGDDLKALAQKIKGSKVLGVERSKISAV